MFRGILARAGAFAQRALRVPRSSRPAQLLGTRGLGVLGGLGLSAAAPRVAAAWAGGVQPSSLLSTLAGNSALNQLQFKEMGMLSWLVVDVAINWGGWALATLLKTEKFYDLCGSISFLTLATGSLLTGGPITARKVAFTAMVGCWALRLGSYLVGRVVQTGGDSRFDEAKHQPATFFVYWTMQAVWVFTTLLPLLVLNTGGGGPARLLATDVAGAALFAGGFLLEVVADWQKARWRAEPANKGKFIDEGLWSLARHPNYAGEMALWAGVFVGCAGAFSAAGHWATVASPLLVALLLCYVSGVPIQAKQAAARWGHTAEYQEYLRRTNLLLPLPKLKLKE